MLSKKSIEFIDDLKANNNRNWFLDNKKRYEVFKKDYYQLVTDFLDAMKPLDASIEMLEVKNCTFRINRDIRFSKDKSPYKDHIGVWLSSGSKGINRSGYYVHIARSGSFVAGGLYCPEAEDLKKVRKEIAYFYEDLEEILLEVDFCFSKLSSLVVCPFFRFLKHNGKSSKKYYCKLERKIQQL